MCYFQSYYLMHTYLFTRSIFSVISDLHYSGHLRLHFLFIYLRFSICFIGYLSLGHYLQTILLYLHAYHRLFILFNFFIVLVSLPSFVIYTGYYKLNKSFGLPSEAHHVILTSSLKLLKRASSSSI